jgi:NAD-reducing hydrogenase small subunit
MERLKLATVWLGGCSGCHMSFLDLDEFLVDLAGKVDIVYSPFVDAKEYPEGVDAVLVEGAVANEEHVEMALRLRARSKMVISFGDCAVTGNVTALRNPIGTGDPVLMRSYMEGGDINATIPSTVIPRLLEQVTPLHVVIPVDFYIPGCPPPAPRIRTVLEQLIAGEAPCLSGPDIRFG